MAGLAVGSGAMFSPAQAQAIDESISCSFLPAGTFFITSDLQTTINDCSSLINTPTTLGDKKFTLLSFSPGINSLAGLVSFSFLPQSPAGYQSDQFQSVVQYTGQRVIVGEDCPFASIRFCVNLGGTLPLSTFTVQTTPLIGEDVPHLTYSLEVLAPGFGLSQAGLEAQLLTTPTTATTAITGDATLDLDLQTPTGSFPQPLPRSITVTTQWSSPQLGSTITNTLTQDLLPQDTNSVPGPLPVMGAASAFAWSRNLRRRLRGRRRKG